jgi:hypothetical protein
MKIFLAHASEDKDLVRDLHSRLRSHGFNPWLDELDIPVGKNWRTAIPKAIRESDIFIACLSQRSVQKQGYIQREFRLALEVYAEKPPETIYLIPLKFDECEIPDLQLPTLSISLRDFQWLDYWKADGFDRLVISIELEVKKNSIEAKLDRTSSVILKGPDAESVVLDSGNSSATDINPESECKTSESFQKSVEKLPFPVKEPTDQDIKLSVEEILEPSELRSEEVIPEANLSNVQLAVQDESDRLSKSAWAQFFGGIALSILLPLLIISLTAITLPVFIVLMVLIILLSPFIPVLTLSPLLLISGSELNQFFKGSLSSVGLAFLFCTAFSLQAAFICYSLNDYRHFTIFFCSIFHTTSFIFSLPFRLVSIS